MWALPVKSKRGHLTPWGKLLTIMSHHVSARNWTQVLWNSHLSSPIVSAFLENRPRVFCGSGIIFAHLSNHRNPQHNYHFMCLSLVFATCTWKPKIEIKIWHPNPPPCLPLVLVFWERVSTEPWLSWNYVGQAQAGLEFTEIYLPQPPKCWD